MLHGVWMQPPQQLSGLDRLPLARLDGAVS